MLSIQSSKEYKEFLESLKATIKSTQIRASLQVNQELLKLYWEIGKAIYEKQSTSSWGDSVIKQLGTDLKNSFPGVGGFSRTNLYYMRQWYASYKDYPNVQQVAGQIPWGHIQVLLDKVKSPEIAEFYIKKTIENSWSRNVLEHWIESDLVNREGKAITNFESKLPEQQSDLAQQLIKDPYVFDFLNISQKSSELELERKLIENITQFLVELGSGFAYMGRQFRLEVGGDEFFIDLLFYHVKLRSYIVFEIKTEKFKPEFTGQLNFYVTTINKQLKSEEDNPTIGILICSDKNDFVVEYALSQIDNPMGVSKYEITRDLPDKLEDILPSEEDLKTLEK